MRQLLGRANSSNVMKVIWLLEELELPYERSDAGGPYGRTNAPDYRAMNPTGRVPTLVEDGWALWESNAILRYLCIAYAPGNPIWPEDHRARAGVDRWMDWQQASLNRPQSVVFQGLVRTPPERQDMAAIKAAAVELAEYWSLLDRAMTGRDYVAGPGLTLADMALGVHVHRWFAFDLERPTTPHLRAWYERLLERPAYAAHVAQPMT